MRGQRKSWNKVNDEKVTEGVIWCPEPEYTRKATSDAIAGMDMDTAMFAARIISIDCTWLRENVS